MAIMPQPQESNMGISKRTKWHIENVILMAAVAACFIPKYGLVWNIAFYLMEK